MLRLGGYLNILIAIGHIVGLIWAKQMFVVTGIGKEMQELAQTNLSLPYLVTALVAMVFLMFGLYGLSASGKFKELPFLKLGIFIISGIYIFRGLIGLLFDITKEPANSILTAIYSLIALFIGLLYLFGGLKRKL